MSTGPGANGFRRTLLCVTEDWFALSHFVPLVRALQQVSSDVVVAARDTGRGDEIAALGVRWRPFDFARRSRSPLALTDAVRRLGQLLDEVGPDALHLVAVQTIVLGALAARGRQQIALGLHVTGLGALGGASGVGGLPLIGALTRRHRRHLFVENPEDRALFEQRAWWPAADMTQLGGAGIDPLHFAAAPEPDTLRVGFSGRLVRQKGVHVLIEAVRLLAARGRAVPLDLFAKLDAVTRAAFAREDIDAWQRDGLAIWHGPIEDIRTAWARCAICVAPSVSREGLPRAILEAAAAGRPLIVSDVAGLRHFVRDGIEGFIVPPNDPSALADAIDRLARDPDLRLRMGRAARERVLDGFTEAAVEVAITASYRNLASRPLRSVVR